MEVNGCQWLQIDYTTQYGSMEPFFRTLQGAGIRGLVYNGDTDMACNFLGDEWFVEALGYEASSASSARVKCPVPGEKSTAILLRNTK